MISSGYCHCGRKTAISNRNRSGIRSGEPLRYIRGHNVPAENFIGQTFTYLTVKAKLPSVNGDVVWECICECGSVVEVRSDNLRSGNTKSCGCLIWKNAIQKGLGRDKNITRISWRAMKRRCVDPTNESFLSYGAKGITFDPRWTEFDAFLGDLGERPGVEYSLSRIDHEKDYGPDNCEWALKGTH